MIIIIWISVCQIFFISIGKERHYILSHDSHQMFSYSFYMSFEQATIWCYSTHVGEHKPMWSCLQRSVDPTFILGKS
jgi:hypothetical protein